MIDDFLILNIREYLRQGKNGEDMLRHVFSNFSCEKNIDVERFLLQQSIEFTKKNQSVTYIVITPEYGQIVGYFTITIKPITVSADSFSNRIKKKIARVSEQDAVNGNYSLSAYLIAQIGKNYKNKANKAITGEQLLGLILPICREFGEERVLLTCDKDNEASRRTIINNQGILENEVEDTVGLGQCGVIQRYWITL